MNFRATPPATAKGRKAWLFVSILLPALASKVNTQRGVLPPPPDDESRPYLQVIGPTPLRFEETLPPPDLTVRPPAGAPPKPEATAGPDVVPSKPAASAGTPQQRAAAAAAAVAAAKNPAATRTASTSVSAGPGATADAAPPPPPPAPIIPDDVPAAVHPEDFLPYFQYPGSAPRADGVRQPPAPAPLPPSSATYTQE
jgi:hypothetical protein